MVLKSSLLYLCIIVLNIIERHSLLSRTIGTHPLEDISHDRANILNILAPVFLILLLSLEFALYNVYSRLVGTKSDFCDALNPKPKKLTNSFNFVVLLHLFFQLHPWIAIVAFDEEDEEIDENNIAEPKKALEEKLRDV